MLILKVFISFILSLSANAHAKDKLSNFFKDKTRIDNPFSLRDPFKPAINKTEKSNSSRGFILKGKGEYSNIAEQDLDQLKVNDLKVVGILIGKERRALINTSEADKKIVILKEGMKIGQESAELKAILPGGIVLVEKIINVYGEEEYLETVIPISK